MRLQSVIDDIDYIISAKGRLLDSYNNHSPYDRLTKILAEVLQHNIKELCDIRTNLLLVDSLEK